MPLKKRNISKMSVNLMRPTEVQSIFNFSVFIKVNISGHVEHFPFLRPKHETLSMTPASRPSVLLFDPHCALRHCHCLGRVCLVFSVGEIRHLRHTWIRPDVLARLFKNFLLVDLCSVWGTWVTNSKHQASLMLSTNESEAQLHRRHILTVKILKVWQWWNVCELLVILVPQIKAGSSGSKNAVSLQLISGWIQSKHPDSDGLRLDSADGADV